MSGWEHFSTKELECPHCKKIPMNKMFMAKLVAVRRELGIPLNITSGYRCPEYNKSIGGVASSSHVKGRAVDIAIDMSEANQIRLLRSAIEHGLTGIGINDKKSHFIHLDDTRPRLWTY